MRLARLDRRPERRAVGQQVALTHQLVKRPRAHPYCQGCVGDGDCAGRSGIF